MKPKNPSVVAVKKTIGKRITKSRQDYNQFVNWLDLRVIEMIAARKPWNQIVLFIRKESADWFGENSATSIGAKGGKSRSKAKIMAARMNGLKGGRPVKKLFGKSHPLTD